MMNRTKAAAVAAISRAYRTRTPPAFLLIVGTLFGGCGSHPPTLQHDLIQELPNAERRAAGPVDEAIRIDVAGRGESARLSLLMRAPARVIWSVRLPQHPHLRTAVALIPDVDDAGTRGVTARVGISDGRSYDQPFLVNVRAASNASIVWQQVDIDLHEYSGWQWSIFYRPSSIAWRLNFSVDATPSGTLAWARPMIEGR